MRDLRKFINESVREAVNEEMMRHRISSIIKEEISKKLHEDDDSKKKEHNDEKTAYVMNGLKDPKFNHAQLMRDLWHPKDKGEEDTLRSLFSKMANGTPDADGYTRHFSEDEINKLYQVMRKRQ